MSWVASRQPRSRRESPLGLIADCVKLLNLSSALATARAIQPRTGSIRAPRICWVQHAFRCSAILTPVDLGMEAVPLLAGRFTSGEAALCSAAVGSARAVLLSRVCLGREVLPNSKKVV